MLLTQTKTVVWQETEGCGRIMSRESRIHVRNFGCCDCTVVSSMNRTGSFEQRRCRRSSAAWRLIEAVFSVRSLVPAVRYFLACGLENLKPMPSRLYRSPRERQGILKANFCHRCWLRYRSDMKRISWSPASVVSHSNMCGGISLHRLPSPTLDRYGVPYLM